VAPLGRGSGEKIGEQKRECNSSQDLSKLLQMGQSVRHNLSKPIGHKDNKAESNCQALAGLSTLKLLIMPPEIKLR
jgi:hypothetical protein